MVKRLGRGWLYTITILQALSSTSQRRLLRRMITLSRSLSNRFSRPLPLMMAHLTPSLRSPDTLSPDALRRLADAVAAWHLCSPLGLCLRRSLLRYYFLQEAGLPVSVVFGARFKNEYEGGGIGGHAWLTLDGRPYYEDPADYKEFVEMYVYPETEI